MGMGMTKTHVPKMGIGREAMQPAEARKRKKTHSVDLGFIKSVN